MDRVNALLLVLVAAGCGGPPDVVTTDLGDASAALCSDGIQDQNETDVDCGGECQPCGFGEHCGRDADCGYAACTAGVCTPIGSTCADRVKDGAETDVDCGGGCPRCEDGKMCQSAGDCESGSCTAGVCAAGKPPFAFDPPRFLDIVTRGPLAILARDFDGDGKLDVAAIGSLDTELALERGRGDGTFEDSIRIPLGATPNQLAAGDLDGDGRPDLVITFGVSGNVGVFLNSGGGQFRALPPMPLPGLPVSIAIADLDGDKHLDVLIGCQQSGQIGVFLGKGDGTFKPGALTLMGGPINGLATGDFDRDGQLDAVALINGTPAILHGDGKGGLVIPAAPASYERFWFVLAADLQHRGILDIVTASYQGSVGVLLGVGDGSFSGLQTSDLGGAPFTVAAADLDGDGKLDLVTANDATDTVQILRGHGDGSFDTARNYFVGGSLRDIAVGDFNGDGKPDVALCDFRTHDVGVMLNRSGP